jgi:hypothetical protein
LAKLTKERGHGKTANLLDQTRYCRIKVQVEDDSHFTEPLERDENSGKANVITNQQPVAIEIDRTTYVTGSA